MNWKEFFKPTWKKLIFFVIFVIVMWLFLSLTHLKIFPCISKPVFPASAQFKFGFCDLCVVDPYCGIDGIAQKASFISKILYFILIFAIPYILAAWLIHKKFSNHDSDLSSSS